jgi:hypothetical protein
MALEDFTVSQNTGHVEQATGSMSMAQIDDIERRAKATKTTVEVDSARAESAEHEAAGKPVPGSSEAKLYGDIIADAAGLKTVSTAAEMIGERQADRAANEVAADVSSGRTEGIARNPVHIESDIALANRPAGAYRAPAEQNAFGANTPEKPSVSKPGVSVRTRATAGEDLMASANIATSSLKDQHKEAVGSWDVKETKMAGVALAKKLSFGQEYASELALQSAMVAKQQYSATVGHAMQMSPGMGMNGPSFKGADIMKMAQEEADLNRWRTQQS